MSYTPNKQRILEALGYKAKEQPLCDCGDRHCDYYYDTVFRIVGKESLGYFCDTEPEAWNSVDFDANFCFREIVPWVRLQDDFTNILIEDEGLDTFQVIFSFVRGDHLGEQREFDYQGNGPIELAICEAFESFLTSIGK